MADFETFTQSFSDYRVSDFLAGTEEFISIQQVAHRALELRALVMNNAEPEIQLELIKQLEERCNIYLSNFEQHEG